MELTTVEWVTFGLLLAACVATLPAVAAHVRATSGRIDQVAQLMATSGRFRARLAGGMHLTWGTVFLGSLAVVLAAAGLPTASTVAGTVFLATMVLDLAVFATGRPSAVVLHRHRAAARRR